MNKDEYPYWKIVFQNVYNICIRPNLLENWLRSGWEEPNEKQIHTSIIIRFEFYWNKIFNKHALNSKSFFSTEKGHLQITIYVLRNTEHHVNTVRSFFYF